MNPGPDFALMLPWLVVGALVVIGAITAMVAGLPWQTRKEAALHQELMATQLRVVTESQSLLATTLSKLADTVQGISELVAVLKDRTESSAKIRGMSRRASK